MVLETDKNEAQSKGQNGGKFPSGTKSRNDTKLQNVGKGQNHGKALAGEADLVAGNTKKQDDPYSDAEDSSDEQEMTRQHHLRIVNSWLRKKPQTYNLDDENHRRARFKSNADKQNIIHRAIKEIQKQGHGVPDQALNYIKETILQRPELFTDKDIDNNVPMIGAANSLPSILFMVLDLLISDSTWDKISTKCEKGQQCPLWDVSDGRRKQCERKKIIEGTNGTTPDGEATAEKASERLNGELENDRARCLHDEVDLTKLLTEDKKLKDVLQRALNSVAEARTCIRLLVSETKFDPDQTNPQLIKLESFRTILKLCHNDAFEKAPSSGYSPLQQAVRLLDGETLDFELVFKVIRTLVEHCPASIFCKVDVNGTPTTAYRLLKELKKTDQAPNKDWIRCTDELLKEKCIGFKKEVVDPKTNEVRYDDMWQEKSVLLYWNKKTGKSSPSPTSRVYKRASNVATEKQFRLNLAGETVILEEVYIDTIKDQAGMRLESVLNLVKLPYWKPPGAKLHRPKSQVPGALKTPDDPEIKPDPYISIFQWLWDDCEVQKIFTVDVDDEGQEPHTNAAIRQCLRGIDSKGKPTRDFKVEVWKWKKFDICSDTIFIAAPEAREVHLFSRGNTAVLRGWASETGLAKLKRASITST